MVRLNLEDESSAYTYKQVVLMLVLPNPWNGLPPAEKADLVAVIPRHYVKGVQESINQP